MSENPNERANGLKNESSLYLLQHVHNPVDWHPWGSEVLNRAKRENKPLLVSIGYSSCHWCHVMAHESFEDEEVATYMNRHFICVKVDREERPDIDNYYMEAVQALTGRGGWPLNVFALPDGRPFWGGTYFPKKQWLTLLEQVVAIFEQQRNQLERQVSGREQNQLSGIFGSVSEELETPEALQNILSAGVNTLRSRFDYDWGGMAGAPKFPLPGLWRFLLRYSELADDKFLRKHILLTLRKMAYGGLFDQAGGGFARYSTDAYWHIPHFEKMLYDNAQLLELYAEAWEATKEDEFLEVIHLTTEFLEREMAHHDGGYYSALDADSDGEEGRFYVWTLDEMQEILGDKLFPVAAELFGLNGDAYWEEGKNVLVRNSDVHEVSAKLGLTEEEVRNAQFEIRQKLLAFRSKRSGPATDTKVITCWNALLLSAYCKIAAINGDEQYYHRAVELGLHIGERMWSDEGVLYRNFINGRRTIPGFLDDYAASAGALFSLALLTEDYNWMDKGLRILDRILKSFGKNDEGLYLYTPHEQNDIPGTVVEYFDSVIPSSNSMLAGAFLSAFRITHDNKWYRFAEELIQKAGVKLFNRYPVSAFGWGESLLQLTWPAYTVVGRKLTHADRNTGKYLPEVI
ncbi:MAG: thioredoxin domain-containing protein [Bacteroidales bacterium]